MTITKAHIVEKLNSKKLFAKGKLVRVVEMLFELIKQSLEQGEDVLMTAFEKFSVREKEERIGHNPQSGQSLVVSARRVVTFKCSQILRQKMKRFVTVSSDKRRP